MVAKEVLVGGDLNSVRFWGADRLDQQPYLLLLPLLTDSPELDLTVEDVMKEEENQEMEMAACDWSEKSLSPSSTGSGLLLACACRDHLQRTRPKSEVAYC